AEGAGRVVLMDFGTAHEREGAGASSGGTPLFAAPELLAGGAPSPASDLYALGVVLYRLVTGRFPIEAASLAELRDRHARRAFEPLRALRPDLPAPFVQAVERALAPEPRQRFRDAAEMEHALAATLGGARGAVEVRASWRRVLAGAAAGALLVALAWAGVRWVPEWTRPRLRVAPAGPARATRVLQTLVGDEVAGHFGYAVANVGDLDGDGIPELLVGALDEANDSGRVHLYKGMPDGSYRPWRTFETGALCVAALGDVNHDGIPDFAVGNPNDDAHGKRVGVVHVYFGDRRLGGVHAADLYPPRGGTLFGYSVAGAGDVNGDGYADIVVGAPNDAGDGRAAGIAYVYYGGARIGPGPNLTLRPHSIAGQFGIAVAGIGDFNGDGFADFAVGANVDRKSGAGTGRVAIYYGGRTPAAEPALDLYGPHDNTWFGIALAGLGDVDGDGFDDLAVGAERGDGFEPLAGSVSVFRGGQHPAPLPWKVLRGPAAHSMFGHALAAGDVLGDGRPNLVVGGFYVQDEGFAAGATYVYDLLRKGDSPELELTGTDDHGNLGTSVAVVPARPGAHAGVIAGAPYSGTSEGGAVWVFGISRHAFTRPHAGERWTAGASERVAWLGAARADLEWSPAGREAWQPLATGVGGHDQNTAAITVPRVAGPIVLRLRPAGPRAAAATLSDTVFVDAAR
ncbi:MAG TPA: FG-GAP-like repeat-containing protein, partial [Candidatus Eisenbacteria bacterium]|nr:FG-GAP-like repeat-containing protein [Candidatus Eisenbacteria bacterium]